jgi:hypothetical protein
MAALLARLLGFAAPYLLPAAAAAAIAGGGLTLWYRSAAHDAAAALGKAKGELAQATVFNQAQAQTITELRAQAAVNDRIVAQISADIAAIHADISASNEALHKLKDDNADVRTYLGTPVPAPLGELYNGHAAARRPAADREGKSAGRAP